MLCGVAEIADIFDQSAPDPRDRNVKRTEAATEQVLLQTHQPARLDAVADLAEGRNQSFDTVGQARMPQE